MRAVLPILAFALVALAGCAEPVEGDEPPTGVDGRESRPADGGNGTLRHFEQEFDLTLTGTWTEVQSTGLPANQNCILVERAPFTITAGNATATWTAQSTLAQELELTIVLFFGSHREEYASASPLEADFGSLATAPATSSTAGREPFYAFVLQYPEPGDAAVTQEARLRLAFSYVADHEVDVSLAGCSMD